MITITCTYNKLTRDYGTCRIDGAKNYKQARYATGGKPNYPVPAKLEHNPASVLIEAMWYCPDFDTWAWDAAQWETEEYSFDVD